MSRRPFNSTCLQLSHTIPASHPRNPKTIHDPNAQLQLAVDEYTILDPASSAATLIFTHGTSFNKRSWEPTIWRLLKATENGAWSGCVKRILVIDASNHGDSYLLNANLLTKASYWPDQSRDILQVLKCFQVKQPVIGIGHSFGGGIMAHAAILDPSAFVGTIFIDPILFQMKEQTDMIAQRALRRRDRWDSLQDVRLSLANNKGFSDWHPEVLKLHIDHSTRDIKDGQHAARTLTTPKEQEAATYLAAPHPDLPRFLSESKQNHCFILGGKSIVVHPADREWIKSISRTQKQVVVMEDAGHLIPMTHPEELCRFDLLPLEFGTAIKIFAPVCSLLIYHYAPAALHLGKIICAMLSSKTTTTSDNNLRSLL